METNDVLKTLHIAQALDNTGFSWNQHLPEDMRQPLQEAAINKALEKTGAQLVLEEGELKVYAKGSKEIAFDETGQVLTLNRLVKNSFTGLGSFEHTTPSQSTIPSGVFASDDRSTPKVYNAETGETSWTGYDGKRYFQRGSTTSVKDPLPVPRALADPKKEAERQLHNMLKNI